MAQDFARNRATEIIHDLVASRHEWSDASKQLIERDACTVMELAIESVAAQGRLPVNGNLEAVLTATSYDVVMNLSTQREVSELIVGLLPEN